MAMKIPRWTWYVVVAVVAVAVFFMAGAAKQADCPGSYVWCPGVGCVSGSDKCVPGNKGGPSAVFSKEGFEVMKPKPWNVDWAKFTDPAFHFWPGAGKASIPAEYGKEKFVNRKCADGTRTDGPCLMDFPEF
jgi:hypothetical protein